MQRFNKKTAHRFNLIHRSQQDPLYHAEGGSLTILHPSDERTANQLQRLPFAKETGATNYVIKDIREVDEQGLPLDGYDYGKHLSSLGGGTFMNASGVVEKVPEALLRPRANVLELPAEALASEVEMPRMLEAITLRPDLMDEDMRRALEGETDDEAGELDDDFMAQIITQDIGDAGGDDNEFDFDAHVARLMKKAEEEEEEEEADDEEDRSSPQTKHVPRPLRDVDAHFEAVMHEYDDDDDEDKAEEDDQEPEGHLEAANEIVLDAMNEFLRARAEDRTVGDVAHPPPRQEILSKLPNHLEPGNNALQSDEEEDSTPVTEGDVLDAWGTYKYTPKAQFDCATIVTTLSTLDNHPSMIEVPGRNRDPKPRRKPSDATSNATDELAMDVAKLTIQAIAERVKGESADDKRLRKQSVKDAKRNRRVEKKQLKEAFKVEKAKLIHAMTAPGAPRSGVAEFKI